MLSLIRKNLFQRPLRYLLIALAIAFGVASVTGIFIFTDGLRSSFAELGEDIESGYDLSIHADTGIGSGLESPLVPVELSSKVEAIEGVKSVEPRIVQFGILPIDAIGKPLTPLGGPALGVNWGAEPKDSRLFTVDGTAPLSEKQFALDVDSFNRGEFVIGDTYRIMTPSSSFEAEFVGTFNYGDEDKNATLGALIVAFEQDFALEVLNKGAGYNDLTVSAEPGVALDTLIAKIEPLLDELGDDYVVKTQEEVLEDTQAEFAAILDVLRTVLLVFAVIVLLVSAFLIFNVFTITLTQRIKELGLLRSIGALGSQITNMMLLEAVFLGLFATAIGFPMGLGLARILRMLFNISNSSIELPLPVRWPTVVYAVLIGVLVTTIAAVLPAFRARRVTPLAAMRDGADERDLEIEPNPLRAVAALIVGTALLVGAFAIGSWTSLLLLPVIGGVLIYFAIRTSSNFGRSISGIVLLGLGVVLLFAVLAVSLDVGPTFGLLGAGALLAVLGAAQVSSLLVKPVVKTIGQPFPMGILVLLLGSLFAFSAAASFVMGIMMLGGATEFGESSFGSPGLGVAAIFGTVAFALVSVALIRTGIGSFGLTGRLARDNAARNSQRTATTATALMIGLALVTCTTVIGASIKASVVDAFDSGIVSDFFVQGPQNGPTGTPFSTEAVELVRDLEGTRDVISYNYSFNGYINVRGANEAQLTQNIPTITAALTSKDDSNALQKATEELGFEAIEPRDVMAIELDQVLDHVDPKIVEIDESISAYDSIWLESSHAQETGFEVGDDYLMMFVDGEVETLKVAAIFEDPFVIQNRVIDNSRWQEHFPPDSVVGMMVRLEDGVDVAEAKTRLENAVFEDYPVLLVQDKDDIQGEAASQIDQILATVNVLLMLSGAIAALGIAIALSLAVFERTREIGLLRAVGLTKAQTRRMIRWEGVIVAGFGGIVGTALGIGLGVLASEKMPETFVRTTSIPWGQLLVYVLVAALTGLAAGGFPAWLAGRLNVLEAISHD